MKHWHGQAEEQTREIPLPDSLSEPNHQAMHDNTFVVVGTTAIGETQNTAPTSKGKNGKMA